MSDTPRNDKLTNLCAGCSDALHLILIDELSRKLESELTAANASIDKAVSDLTHHHMRRGGISAIVKYLAEARKGGAA